MRTSKKNFIRQITQIERRQARIRQIRLKSTYLTGQNDTRSIVVDDPEFSSSPEARYHVGATQNLPVNIPQFLQRNAGDPAVNVRFFYRYLSYTIY